MLWERVDKGGPDECWNWQGAKHPSGHGNLKANGRYWRAHRLAWHLAKGPIPAGLEVLHRCDNPACCNPAHLFLGTETDNQADKLAKGRQAKGQMFPHTKLSADQVRAIRADRRIHREIAADYGIDRANVSYIKARKSWTHVA